MKQEFLSTTLTMMAITLGTTLITDQSSYAQDTTFACLLPGRDQLNGQSLSAPTLTISTPATPTIPLMQWSTPVFEKWDYNPSTRCNNVALKFQKYCDCELLDPESITLATFPGIEDGRTIFYPVILTVKPPVRINDKGCLPSESEAVSGLLFMLPPTKDITSAASEATNVLKRLEDIRFYTDGEPIQN